MIRWFLDDPIWSSWSTGWREEALRRTDRGPQATPPLLGGAPGPQRGPQAPPRALRPPGPSEGPSGPPGLRPDPIWFSWSTGWREAAVRRTDRGPQDPQRGPRDPLLGGAWPCFLWTVMSGGGRCRSHASSQGHASSRSHASSQSPGRERPPPGRRGEDDYNRR